MPKGQELAGRGDQAELLGSSRLDSSQEEGLRARSLLGSRPWARVASSETDSPPEAPKSAPGPALVTLPPRPA